MNLFCKLFGHSPKVTSHPTPNRPPEARDAITVVSTCTRCDKELSTRTRPT